MWKEMFFHKAARLEHATYPPGQPAIPDWPECGRMDHKEVGVQQHKSQSPMVIFFLIIFCLILALFYRFSVQNAKRIQHQNLEYADDSARLLAIRLNEQFKGSQHLIETYAYFMGQTIKNEPVATRLLKEMETNTYFDAIRYTNRDGEMLTASGERTMLNDKDYFLRGMNGESGVTAVMDSPVFHQPVIVFYAPVRYNNEVIGVLHGYYLATRYLRNSLRTTYFGKPADVFLCLPNGDIISTTSSGPTHGNLIKQLEENGAIDAATASDAMTAFKNGKGASYVCGKGSKSDNLCIEPLSQYDYVIAQTFPLEVTRTMLKNANRTGVELELCLIFLAALVAAALLLRAHTQKKSLIQRNHELALISQGMNILFSGRYLLADFKTSEYTYCGDITSAGVSVGKHGPYDELLRAQADSIPVKSERDEFEEVFSIPNLLKAFERQNTVTCMARQLIDGKEEWEHMTGICVTRESGKPVKFMMVSQNVTDMKEREVTAQKQIADLDRKERQYQLALTSSALTSYEFNVSRDLLEHDVHQFINGRSVSLLQARGFQLPCKASEFLASSRPLLLPESYDEYVKKTDLSWMRKKFYEGTKEIELDYWLQIQPGIEECVRQSIYMVSDDTTGDITALTVLRDITGQVMKQRAQTKALQDALMLAQHANEAKTTFLSNMSHDIRTPMNAIIGFSTIAASHLDNKNQVRECLNKVLSSSNHLLSLINDILDMSRIESGKIQIKEQPCNISEIMHNLVNIIQPQVKAKQMQLFIDTFDIVNEDIFADPLKLNQVFINLLSNAVKYTPAGGTITFQITQKPAFRHGFADFVFEVSDNGVGMSPEFVQHIFEPFTREATSTQTGIQGTGLGMAITKNIVELMNGQIEVKSEPGKGTTFTVSLTLRVQDGGSANCDIKALEGMRALAVDDDFHVCDSVSKMLKKIGLRPEWTTSGREAVYRAQLALEENDPFSTYIIDWQMPDMNGVETARRIRDTVGGNKPIIILTAYEWGDIEDEAKKLGVTAFCSKPLFMSDLKNALLACNNLGDKPAQEVTLKEQFQDARILLVDDVEMNREVAEFILTESGFQVECAPDGTDAVEMVKNSPEHYYDAILMDVQMPTMNGYEATRIIRHLEREDVKTMPILAMTANALEEDKAKSLKSGMNEHIAKPIDIKQFFGILAKYFEKK